MGVLTVLLTILGGSQEREVSLPYPSVALIAQEARTLFPELGSAPLTMQATWWGKEQKPFRLTANNVGLLRNTTTVTVSRNDGGEDAYAAAASAGLGQCKEGDKACTAAAAFAEGNNVYGDAAFANYEMLSERPRIFYFPKFLSDEECDTMVALGKDHIQPSQVTANGGRVDTRVRSSKVHFLLNHEELHDVPQRIKAKTHAATKLPYDHMEALQIQRYGSPSGDQKDFYNPHLDSMYGSDRRIATMIYYLNDCEEGGETLFPYVNANSSGRPHYEYDAQAAITEAQAIYDAACDSDDTGVLKIKPKKGSAVLFYSLLPGGQLDHLSVHSSCPVKGTSTKWISQQWIKESWHEPRISPTCEGYWELDELKKPLNGGGGLVALDLGTPSLPLDGIFAFAKERTASFGLTDLKLALKGSSRTKPKSVIKIGDAMKLCSGEETSLLKGVQASRSLTWVVWVKVTGEEGEESSVTLKTAGDTPLEFSLTVHPGGLATMRGPAKQETGLEVELVPHAWTVLKMVWESKNKFHEYDQQGRWKYESFLLSGPDIMGGRGSGVQQGVDTTVGSVATKGVAWDKTQLCVDKREGTNFAEMFLFSHALSEPEMRHVDIVAGSEKAERDGLKSIAHLR